MHCSGPMRLGVKFSHSALLSTPTAPTISRDPRVIFGSSLEKLRVIKQRYDPNNFLCNNQNVVPADLVEEEQENAMSSD